MTFEQKLGLASLAASLLTPFALIGVGFFLDRRLRTFEGRAARQQKISDARFDLYKEIGFQLNDIYSYFLYVGNWKELSARDVVSRKRTLDRHLYTYRPIFSEQLFERYQAYMSAAFQMHGGMGTDARLRTVADHRAEQGTPDVDFFTGEDNREAVKTAYQAMIDQLAAELDVGAEAIGNTA